MKSVSKVVLGGLTFELFVGKGKKQCNVWDDSGLAYVLNDHDLQLLNNHIMFPWRFGIAMNGNKGD